MKKISLLFCFVSLFTVFNCDEDETQQEIADAASLVGTWSLESLNADITSTANLGGQQFDTGNIVQTENENFTMTFTDSEYSASGSYDVILEITAFSQTQTMNQAVTDVSSSGTYTTNGNELIAEGGFMQYDLNGVGESTSQGQQVVQFAFSNNNQTLTMTQIINQTDDSQGFEIAIAGSSTMVFSKVD